MTMQAEHAQCGSCALIVEAVRFLTETGAGDLERSSQHIAMQAGLTLGTTRSHLPRLIATARLTRQMVTDGWSNRYAYALPERGTYGDRVAHAAMAEVVELHAHPAMTEGQLLEVTSIDWSEAGRQMGKALAEALNSVMEGIRIMVRQYAEAQRQAEQPPLLPPDVKCRQRFTFDIEVEADGTGYIPGTTGLMLTLAGVTEPVAPGQHPRWRVASVGPHPMHEA